MTTIYISKTIETVEEAASLPVGTVSPDGDTPDVKAFSGEWVSAWEVEDGELSGYSITPDSHMVGRPALIPVEAEEETGEDDDADTFTPTSRLVTPWRPASS